jgi:methyltransferase (TIGR00027 family)
MAAAARAAHLIVDGPPVIFADTLAGRLLGDQAEKLLGYHRTRGDHLVLAAARAQATCRSRYTEDRVMERVRAGVRQYVILGAGRDTFAYRSEAASQLRVFEVDHPASQQDKRRRLEEAQIPVPPNVTHVPLDFENGSLADGLAAHGFDPALPAVVAWLGVSMYLTPPAHQHHPRRDRRPSPGHRADHGLLPATRTPRYQRPELRRPGRTACRRTRRALAHLLRP